MSGEDTRQEEEMRLDEKREENTRCEMRSRK